MSNEEASIDDRLIVVDLGSSQLVLDLADGLPIIAHFGKPLSRRALVDIVTVESVARPPIPRATTSTRPPASTLPAHGRGWFGRPGLRGHRVGGGAWAPLFIERQRTIDADSMEIVYSDATARLEAIFELDRRPFSARMRLSIVNRHPVDEFFLDEARLTVPLPRRVRELEHLVGRWSREFQPQRRMLAEGEHGFDNRRGRTSHDRTPNLFVGEAGFDNNHGEVWGFSLGWSGSTAVSAEVTTDGTGVVQLGEGLLPGEICLGAGERYSTPWVDIAYSGRGLNGVSQAFHASIRSRDVAPTSARPVLLNTWEAVYFDHDLDTLKGLADRAADVGAERFVLDDGWFHGRRNDDAGLGDWWVDETVWPDGLEPLIDHVSALGLEFGIWVEPEMVNPNSELYRQHPDWAIEPEGYGTVLGRNQLVLDLGNDAVFSYLFEKLDRLLTDHHVAFVKWDMNRDLVHAADRSGRPTVHRQTTAMYRLIDDLRAAHPDVEIESCASGGARADIEILERTERIWTSDSNDALERWRIQDGFCRVFPPEVMGSHIGPPTSHTSGRTHRLAFRAAAAFWGHLGIEWNVLDMSSKDRADLARIVEHHKRLRPVLHTGDLWRLDTTDESMMGHIVTNADRKHAVLMLAQLEGGTFSIPPRVQLVGLDPEVSYDVTALDLGPVDGPTEEQVGWLASGMTASGAFLMDVGLQAPLLYPESAIVVELKAVL